MSAGLLSARLREARIDVVPGGTGERSGSGGRRCPPLLLSGPSGLRLDLLLLSSSSVSSAASSSSSLSCSSLGAACPDDLLLGKLLRSSRRSSLAARFGARVSPAPPVGPLSLASPADSERRARTCLAAFTTRSFATLRAPCPSQDPDSSRPMASQPAHP